MTLSFVDQALQLLAWSLALVQCILALYILVLNAWHPANRHVSGLFMLFAVNSLALGILIGVPDAAAAVVPTAMLAATSAAAQPTLLLTTVVLLKPQWLPRMVVGNLQSAQSEASGGAGRWRWIWWPIYGLGVVALVTTLLDLVFGTGLWYTGLDAATYAGGYVTRTEYTQGSLAPFIRIVNVYVLGLAPLLPILYVLIFERERSRRDRQLAWLLLFIQGGTLIAQLGLRNILGSELSTLLANAILVFGYAYATFRQLISERRVQRGQLQARLTAQILVITIPLLIAVVLFVSAQAGDEIERSANEQLAATNRALAANVSVWLELNIQSLHQLVSLPDMMTMDPEKQKPILAAMAEAHPHMYLVSTTNTKGINVARSDDADLKDYHDRLWHVGARNGAPVTYQTLVGRTSGEPALVVSMPIRRGLGTIVGVGMFASDLDAIAEEVQASAVGETGFAYVVDGLNQVVAHPIAEYAAELRDLDYYPPVFALRSGQRGAYSFTDEEGIAWQVYLSELENGWGIVVQQQQSELFGTLRTLQRISWLVVGVGTLILAGIMVLAIRQIVQPIGVLTDTATAIAAGELEREAPVESEDEIGTLARAFNSMTRQLRELIDSLEQQVEERTAELVQRSGYLQSTADVGRAVASILEPEVLSRQVVELIRDRFDLYYVGLFLVGKDREYALLQAGTGEAGRTMLARGHRIRVGEGMIGWCIAAGQARVAGEAGEDTFRLATDELPETRSEAALPLASRGQVFGALTVQHTEPGAFGPDVLAVLQTMADQVAVALDNAQLFAASQEALAAERRAYGELSRDAWRELLRGRAGSGYRYARQEVTSVDGDLPPEMARVERSGRIVQGNGDEGDTLAVPIKVRDQVLGVLRLRKEASGARWLADEVALLEELATQLGVALEGARLYESTQRRAAQERLTGEITARIRETLDVDQVLRTAVGEIGRALDLHDLTIRLEMDETEAGSDGAEGENGHV